MAVRKAVWLGPIVPMVLGVFVSGCRVHDLKDAHYTFTPTTVLRDDCNLAGVTGYVSGGSMVTTGDEVRFDYDAFGIEAKGSYLDPQYQHKDRIELDGTSQNIATTISGTQCLIDLMALHLDVTDVDDSHFTGTMTIKTDLPRPEVCVCQLWVEFTAQAN